ncbi:hypothetical protein HII31_07880 [Pseudocercospora fuligena]|uniref:Uncharacterized protein n=1 Tax=Pseudocercospora fuligena TaxID=685502 RepID=A0A8H6RGM2_9PEZI|nr:hypothetical protein HII31_07880 [Pseudocercospora fuligena]
MFGREGHRKDGFDDVRQLRRAGMLQQTLLPCTPQRNFSSIFIHLSKANFQPKCIIDIAMHNAARLRRRGAPITHDDIVKERNRRTLVKDYRDQRAQDAWEKWTSNRRTKWLHYHPDLLLASCPKRLLKKDGYCQELISKIRNVHRIPVYPAPTTPSELGNTVFDKLAAFIFTTFAIFFSLAVPTYLFLGPWAPESSLTLHQYIIAYSSFIATITAVHAVSFEYSDYETFTRFWLPTKQHSKKLPDDHQGDPSDKALESESTKADREVKDLVSLALQSNDPGLKNTRRIAEALQYAKVARKVQPLTTDKDEIPLAQVLAQSSLPGRDYRPLKQTKNVQKSEHRFHFADHNANAKTEAKDTSIAVPFTMLATDASKSDKDMVHQELARIYNTFPFEISKPGVPLKQLWVAQAFTNLFGHPLQLDRATVNHRVQYRGNVYYINADTGKHERLDFKVTATDSTMDAVSVPPIEPVNLFNAGSDSGSFKSITTRDPNQPLYIPAPASNSLNLGKKETTSRKSQRKAEDAVYWIASQTQGMIATKDRMKELLVQLKEQIGLAKGRTQQSGIYGGESALYNHHTVPAELSTRLHPTKRVARDLGMDHQALRLVIYSLNCSRVTPVMETLVQLYFNGDDLRKVWIEGAKSADLVNQDIASGVPPHSACDCDDLQTSKEMHVCEGCAKPTLCKTRTYDSLGRLVCVDCFKRDQLSRDNSRAPDETFVSSLSRISLWRNFRKECVTKGKDPQSTKYKTIYNNAWNNLKATLPGKGKKSNSSASSTKCLDVYTGKQVDVGQERGLVGNNPSRRRWIPSGITVDAVHGAGEPANAGLKHSGKNTVITTDAVQLAKGRFLPGVTHEIAKFLRNPQKTQELVKESLVKRINEMTLVLVKRPYIQNGLGSDEDKYAKIIAESVSGKAAPNEQGPWQDRAYRYVSTQVVPPYNPAKPKSSIWSQDVWQKSQACARSMEEYFGVTLYTLDDGTRWIGSSWSNPSDLDRNGVATFCDERLKRMRLRCNKKWKTKDTPLSLYREMIFQYCCSVTEKDDLQWLKQKYGDRLGLPLVLSLNNPLRLSVAHREHGFGMFTGWLDENAVSVDGRLAKDNLNNMLIESWYVNSAKMDMAEEFYPELDEILRSVNIKDKAIYDPEAAAGVPTANVQPAEDVPIVDDFAMATFENVMDDGDSLSPTESSGGVGEETRAPDDTAEEDEPMEPDTADASTAAQGQDEVSELDTMLANLYTMIFASPRLQDVLKTNAELQRLLGQLRSLADEEDTSGFHAYYGSCMEDWIDPVLEEEQQQQG